MKEGDSMSSFFMTIAVLLFVSTLSAVGGYLFKRSYRTSLPPEELSIQTMRTVILEKLQSVRELAMIRSNFQSIVHFTETKKIMGHTIPYTTRKFILSYSGTVVCGCDLNEVKFANNFFNRNHLQITLPESRIFDMYPDLNTVKLHDQNAELFAKDVNIEDQNRAITVDLKEVKQRLIKEGLLIKSNDKVQKFVNSIVEPLGIKAVITFVSTAQLPEHSELPRLN